MRPSRIPLPAPLRSTPVTAPRRYFERSDSCAGGSSAPAEHEHRPDPAQVSLRPVPCRHDHSVSTHLTCPGVAFTRYPLAPVGSRIAAVEDFASSTQAHRSRPAVSSSSSYGLVTPRRLLPTSPHGDAVIVGYGPESVCPERTSTSLSWHHCRRTSRAGLRPACAIEPEVPNTSGDATGGPFVFGTSGSIARAKRGRDRPFVRLRSLRSFVVNPDPFPPSSPSALISSQESRLVTWPPATCQKLQRLHMRRIRKQVESSQRLEMVSRVQQPPRIAGHRRRIARDIDESTRAVPGDRRPSPPERFRFAADRR